MLDDLLDQARFVEEETVKSDNVLETTTIKHLELLEPGCLLEKLDCCTTPMGKRLLRKWLMFPLTERDQIIIR